VLTELQNRGVEDILIACVDGLKGFPEAIQSIFPGTRVQLCVILQIRNSLRYIAYKDKREFMKDLRRVYQAPTQQVAEEELVQLEKKWAKRYPIVIRSWKNKWEHLSTYFEFAPQIRKLIYTTNSVEALHRGFRRLLKPKVFSRRMLHWKKCSTWPILISRRNGKPPSGIGQRLWLSWISILIED